MARNLMIQGTMSGAGKSILTAGILRVLAQDGYKVAPFKSQNMALNSFVTRDGREIGRAQALQAFAAGMEPSADMNPILLKPTGQTASQVIVNGLPVGDMRAADYFGKKKEFIPEILGAYERLSERSDIVVIEGAGSPVEINLRENDIVNMGFAQMVDAPVLLVGNIDPGGVFAQLLGTVQLMSAQERARVKGLIINKFRGDKKLLDPGLSMFKEYCDIPFVGVVPYADFELEEEDSLSEKLAVSGGFVRGGSAGAGNVIRIAVVRLPYISNYTDFDIFEKVPDAELIYTDSVEAVKAADMVILPGTKNTSNDLKWLQEKGFDKAIFEAREKGSLIVGICGGFQMLGQRITGEDVAAGASAGQDNRAVSSAELKGLGLLPVETVFMDEKTLVQNEGVLGGASGEFASLNGVAYRGYEIHMGQSFGVAGEVICDGNVLGTYIHGFFDSAEVTGKVLDIISKKKGIGSVCDGRLDLWTYRERELDKLAVVVRNSLDMDYIYRVIEGKA
ncbi:cobyric acid synthase [Butyrivibrio sp. CB08]|uniref:cobyric acid synthase n=1 Tax=Butyrivibrio sp. CB08 TaxID=2364879 RepID=UPI000EA97D65|nr:cobyric acid synthase [Butyrivibrio sp. CB08]RKM59763.1 cobyric acid synthase [Butyrivibrio sp. CB08]